MANVAAVINKNLETYGITDPAQMNAAVRAEVQRMTLSALQAGKDPAEVIYMMGKNFGYAPTEKKEQAKDSKIENITKGQEASKTLGSGGRSESGGLTLDAISKMDDDEFGALVADDKKWKQFGKMMH